MFLVILKEKKLLESFTKKNCKKQFKESLIKGKCIKLSVKWNSNDNSFVSGWIDKEDILYKSEFVQKPKSLRKLRVELDLSHYPPKTDFKNVAGIDTSSFPKKVDLANVESNIDKLDIDKLKNCTKWFTQFEK